MRARLVTQSCLPLCDPIDYSPPGSSVHGISPRQEYWSGLPSPPPGDLPNPGMEPRSPALQADSLLSGPPGKSRLMAVEPILMSDPEGMIQLNDSAILLKVRSAVATTI